MFVTLQVPAPDIVPGDFTTFTGFRRVCAVTPVTHTYGRGKKRRTLVVGYRLHRFDGTNDLVRADVAVTVRRLQSDGPS